MKLGHSFLSDVSRVRHVLDTGTLNKYNTRTTDTYWWSVQFKKHFFRYRRIL